MEGIDQSDDMRLQVLVTGMHLSTEYGATWNEIVNDGFRVDGRIETLLASDTGVGVAKSIGLGVSGFADAFAGLSPDIVVVLGDRYEILAAAIAAMCLRIPIAHIHGGETSEGAMDEGIRHSITKLSHFHFVATGTYRRRVIQLGENPDNVFVVGGLGIDSIKRLHLLDRSELEASLGLRFRERSLLVTFHPVTLEKGDALGQTAELLAALDELEDTTIVFTMPNADMENRVIQRAIKDFVLDKPDAFEFTSLGQLRYLSCIRNMDGVVGNSSSGLIEVPYFRKGTVNIGSRQGGRIRASTVIDCGNSREEIAEAIARLYTSDFEERLKNGDSPYGEGGASEDIVGILGQLELRGQIKKPFFDMQAPV
jgi:GDP/UDP-N,N'-diacetylbacillosamine 2-epimerase (hydrolysing)